MPTCGRQEHLLGLWKGNSNVTILIDADGCPVVDLTLQTATKYKVPVLILCDTAHQIQRDGAQTLTFDKGPDSVDFALVNRVHPGDLVITQDYGLASMCLARRARVLNQNGLETACCSAATKTKSFSLPESTPKEHPSERRSRT